MVNGFRVELFIDSGEKENIEFSRFNKKDMEQWKKNVEARALSEYYKKKIKIVDQKI